MRALIIGGSGFLGTELVRQATAAGWDVTATFLSRPGSVPGAAWHEVDLCNPERVQEVLAEIEPSVVVNATSGKADWAVTAEGSIRVAMAAAKLGVRLIHVSSDAVFSGSRVHYDETCLPEPAFPNPSPRTAPRRLPPKLP